MGKIYALFTVVSVIIRQFVLPNPFECFGESAVLINWIAEPILHLIAYGLVGLVYIKGSAPLLGSIAYLGTYSLLVGILALLGIFSFAWWWVLLWVIVFAAIVAGFLYIRNLFEV